MVSNATEPTTRIAMLRSRFLACRYTLPRISFSRSRVAAGISLGSVMIAEASAEPHLQLALLSASAVTASRTTLQALAAFFSSTATIWSTVTESCSGCQQS